MNSRSSRTRGLIGGAAAVLALLTVVPAPSAFAQGAPPGDSVTAIARQRYQEGVSAYEAGRYEDARTAFLQAYALKHHPAVLLNLGQAELRSRHEDDAGNHLQQFLREYAQATPDQRAAAEKGIAEAKRVTGLVIVNVDSPGADVSIDGTTVGKTPLLDPVFVKPGKHTVFAALQGKSAASTVEVKAGIATPATLTLGVGPAAPPPAPAPEPAPAPPPAPVPPPVAPPMQPVPNFNPQPVQPPPPMMPPPDMGPPRYTFGEWYKHKPIAWVGTGLAALGLGMGIGGGAAAMSASSASNADTAAIQAEIMKRHDPANVCNGSVLAASPALNAHYGSACSILQGDINSYHTNVAVAATGWAFFGIGVVGTVIYAMVDWYPHRATAAATPQARFAITPIVGPTLNGLGAVGQF